MDISNRSIIDRTKLGPKDRRGYVSSNYYLQIQESVFIKLSRAKYSTQNTYRWL